LLDWHRVIVPCPSYGATDAEKCAAPPDTLFVTSDVDLTATFGWLSSPTCMVVS
jgi:hypothetical protein